MLVITCLLLELDVALRGISASLTSQQAQWIVLLIYGNVSHYLNKTQFKHFPHHCFELSTEHIKIFQFKGRVQHFLIDSSTHCS